MFFSSSFSSTPFQRFQLLQTVHRILDSAVHYILPVVLQQDDSSLSSEEEAEMSEPTWLAADLGAASDLSPPSRGERMRHSPQNAHGKEDDGRSFYSILCSGWMGVTCWCSTCGNVWASVVFCVCMCVCMCTLVLVCHSLWSVLLLLV